jgi:hypothetical protein
MPDGVQANDNWTGTARIAVRNGNAMEYDSAGLLCANGGAIVRHGLPTCAEQRDDQEREKHETDSGQVRPPAFSLR